MKENCSNCFYGRVTDDELRCHRHAPRPMHVDKKEDEVRWLFPRVFSDLWCGEWALDR
jgi:hypothetical protein